MTDGIIQQVTDKYINIAKEKPEYDAEIAIRLMRQELIEKIKREFQSWTRGTWTRGKLDGGSGGYRSMDWYSIQDFKQKLIGDNKE